MTGGQHRVSNRRGRRAVCAAVLGCLAFCSSAVHAQQVPPEDETPVFGAKVDRPFFQYMPFSGYIELTYELTNSKNKTPDSTIKSTEQLFSETLTFETTGAIIHPNVVDLSLSSTAGMRQRLLDQSSSLGEGSNGNDFIYAFDFNAHILRRQLLNYDLFARRNEVTSNREFGPTLINTTTTYGGWVDLQSLVIPSRLQYSHTEAILDDPSNQQGYVQNQDTVTFQSLWNISPNSVLSANYTYNNIDEKPQTAPRVVFSTHDASLIHNYSFGEGAVNNLNSNLTYFKQSGDLYMERMRLEERLTLQHQRNLQSFYRYTLETTERDNFEQTSHTVEAGFRHQLYQSLSTTGGVLYTFQEYSGDQTEQEIQLNVAFDYTKKIPYGTLGLSLALAYDYHSFDAQATPLQIFDESHVMTDPLGFMITRQRIDPTSIIITDAAGIRIFVPGVDYRVASLPNRVQIQRELAGGILNNESVLVDYTVDAQPASNQTTYGVGLGARYIIERGPLKDLGIYGRLYHQEQSIEAADPTQFIPENRDDYLLGATYKIGPFTFTAEQEWRQSDIDPYSSTRVSATFSKPVMENTLFTLDTTYSIVDYPDIDNSIKFFMVTGALNYSLGNRLNVMATASFRDQKDDLFGDVTGFEQQIQLQWRYRQTTFGLLVRNVNLDTKDQENSYQAVQFSVQRRF